MQYTSAGRLIVRTIIAGGALPLPKTLVHIKGADEENRFVEISLLTDEDGITDRIDLPTPNVSFSLAPNPAETPYARYDITVMKEGYYSKLIRNVAVFAGTEAMQTIAMIPFVYGDIRRPAGNLIATVEENPELE